MTKREAVKLLRRYEICLSLNLKGVDTGLFGLEKVVQALDIVLDDYIRESPSKSDEESDHNIVNEKQLFDKFIDEESDKLVGEMGASKNGSRK